MKSRSLDEIEAMLQRQDFQAWWAELESIYTRLGEVEERKEYLLQRIGRLETESERVQKKAVDLLHETSDDEARIAQLYTEAQKIENQALERVGDYEKQRFRTSDFWVQLGAVDNRLESARERLETARSDGKTDLSAVESEIKEIVREQRSIHEAYERESERKDYLMMDVNTLWSRVVELGLKYTEESAAANKKKRDAERLFRQADNRKKEVESLHEEIEALTISLQALVARERSAMEMAEQDFECIATPRFLYYRAKETDKQVWAISLRKESGAYNIEVESGSIYRAVEHERKWRFEPLGAPEESSQDEDRVEAWFRRGYKADYTAQDRAAHLLQQERSQGEIKALVSDPTELAEGQ